VPDEVLTDNGKQFTARFNKGGGEVLFDRICRENGIEHRLTKPRSPTTTGKVEWWHQTIQREMLEDEGPFPDLAAAQAAVDRWRSEYNTARPHQSLDMAFPADRSIASRPGPGPAGGLDTTTTHHRSGRLPVTLAVAYSAALAGVLHSGFGATTCCGRNKHGERLTRIRAAADRAHHRFYAGAVRLWPCVGRAVHLVRRQG
jgi:hypothetical protein